MNTRPRIISILTIFLFALLLSSVNSNFINPVSGAVISTNEQKGLSLLSNVANLNLSNYNVSTTVSQGASNSVYLPGVDEQDISYYLVSNHPLPVSEDIAKNSSSVNNTRFPSVQSTLNALCTFVNGNLEKLYIRERVGVQALSQLPTDNTHIGLAKTFLANYQQYTGNTLCNLGSSISSSDANKNITRTIGNARLEILALNGETTFKWTYNSNGALAPSKFIALGFKDGFLSYFVDNWQLYTIGATNVSVSEDQAKSIALTSAKQHYLSLNPNDSATSDFNASNLYFITLVMDSSLGANNTRGDASTLYPVWRVGIALNQWYGSIYGITVDIWADSGKIRSVQEEYSSLTPQSLQTINSNASINLPMANMTNDSSDFIQSSGQSNGVVGSIDFLLITLLPTVGSTIVVGLLLVRKKIIFGVNLLKIKSKAIAVLIVMLMLTMLFTQIAIASALPSSGGTVWGSESTGQLNGYSGPPYPDAAYWRKTSEEIIAQRATASFIQTQFANTGTFSVCNHQGSLGSDKNTILGDITVLMDIFL